jgi:hypothetical protein
MSLLAERLEKLERLEEASKKKVSARAMAKKALVLVKQYGGDVSDPDYGLHKVEFGDGEWEVMFRTGGDEKKGKMIADKVMKSFGGRQQAVGRGGNSVTYHYKIPGLYSADFTWRYSDDYGGSSYGTLAFEQ